MAYGILVPRKGIEPGPRHWKHWASVFLKTYLYYYRGFPSGSMVKNLPAMEKTPVQWLDQEEALEKEMATHSSILAWKILWAEEPGGLQSMESKRVGHDKATNTHIYLLLFSVNCWLDTKAWSDSGSFFWPEYFICGCVHLHQKLHNVHVLLFWNINILKHWLSLPGSMMSL